MCGICFLLSMLVNTLPHNFIIEVTRGSLIVSDISQLYPLPAILSPIYIALHSRFFTQLLNFPFFWSEHQNSTNLPKQKLNALATSSVLNIMQLKSNPTTTMGFIISLGWSFKLQIRFIRLPPVQSHIMFNLTYCHFQLVSSPLPTDTICPASIPYLVLFITFRS